MNPLDILLIVAGVGYVLVRRVVGDVLEIKTLVVLPLVLTIIGVSNLRGLHHVSTATIAFGALSVLIGVAIGAVRGTTVHLGVREGTLWMRYTWLSVGLWVLNFAAKAAMLPLEHGTDAGKALLLSIGLGIAAENAVVLLRSMRTSASVAWKKGEDGAPHSTSAAYEQARAWVNAPRSADDPHGTDAPRGGFRLPNRDW